MKSFYNLAVVAPIAHTEVAPAAQIVVAPASVSNYVGAAILTVLAVMVAAGLSTAGITKTTKRAKYITPQTAAVMTSASSSGGWNDQDYSNSH